MSSEKSGLFLIIKKRREHFKLTNEFEYSCIDIVFIY